MNVASYDMPVNAYTLGYDAGYVGDLPDVHSYISFPSTREIDEFITGYNEGRDAYEADLAFVEPTITAYLRYVA